MGSAVFLGHKSSKTVKRSPLMNCKK